MIAAVRPGDRGRKVVYAGQGGRPVIGRLCAATFDTLWIQPDGRTVQVPVPWHAASFKPDPAAELDARLKTLRDAGFSWEPVRGGDGAVRLLGFTVWSGGWLGPNGQRGRSDQALLAALKAAVAPAPPSEAG